ncbi:complement C3, partial [Pyrgilauda ruficollis]|uniref:complement C3 n=2 Tax=Pyrgilauda ruficollis TaxID=221976 RepID=UPI001B85ECB7
MEDLTSSEEPLDDPWMTPGQTSAPPNASGAPPTAREVPSPQEREEPEALGPRGATTGAPSPASPAAGGGPVAWWTSWRGQRWWPGLEGGRSVTRLRPGGDTGDDRGGAPAPRRVTMVTPAVLRLESDEQVVLEAPGLSAAAEASLLVQDFPQKRQVLFQSRVALSPAQGMMATATIKVPAKALPQAQGKQFVTVTARVAAVTLEKVLLVSPQSGHIFVQTDKPIYTPGSTVLCRLFTVGHLMQPVAKTVIVEVKTPDNVIIKQVPVSSPTKNGILTINHNLPEVVSLGMWTISAKFEDSPDQDFSAQFEVKEYVLPSFEVSVDPEEKFLYIDRQADFRVSILARGSDMVEAQRGGIPIVTSPYSIHFTHTPKYFKPGMPFDLTVYVTNPDQSPAPRVTVQADGFQGQVATQRDGTARLVLNMPANKDSVPITVRTAQAGLPPERQASRQMTAQAYRSQAGSGNFLHLAVAATELQPGDNLAVNFHLKTSNNDVRNSVPFFTYLIMTKGRILRAGRQRHEAGQSLVTMTLPVTPELIPSFRIVAYYYVLPGEIVADSVWVDVKDTCMGTLVVKGATEGDNRVHEPGTPMRLRIEGDHKAHVGLVAVDKGVFVLRKNKLTQTRVWDTVEKSDIGCTPGSGRDNIGVFADAGLSLTTSVKVTTPQRSEVQCPQPAKRKRRSLALAEYKGTKAAEYSDKLERKCCEDGMKDNPMGHSCEQRTEYIQEGESCVRAFLDCCRYIKAKRDQQNLSPSTGLARSHEDDDPFLEDSDIVSRSLFPESWLWQVEQLTEPPNELGVSAKTLPVYLKDSITTWEVLAVSLSPSKGLCVADPYEITVMKEFFIDLRLPYSVVRNEQVEIRAILYNYWLHDITVRVELVYNPDLCSPSTAKRRFQQVLRMKAESSRTVSFVIVPLKLGLLDIEVKAAVRNQYVGDGVKKKLRVVPEGMRLEKTVKIVELDPQNKGVNGVQEERVKAADLSDIVPNTESETKVSIQGNPVSIIVEKSIDGAKLKHLIVTPSGCGEQNMIAMTPTVIAVHYLDSTEQWENFGIDRRAGAIELIKKGYTQQLAFRKPDSSYAAFINRPSSTWLTAYVVKVFAMARKLTDIEHGEICGPLKWLILNKQKPDGVFQEDAPVIHKEMVGGYQGAEPEVSLTAFVLIALEEARDTCKDHVNNLDESINKAAGFLARRYEQLARPYTVALASYALALAGKLKTERILMRFSKGGASWEEHNARTYNIEGTSYALLALVQMKKSELAGPVVRWLAQQNYYGGGYGSTQATILVFQALAQYQVATEAQQQLELDVSVLLPRRASPIKYRIKNSNALVARSAETKLNEDFTVKAEGVGKGTMTVVTVYHAKVPEKDDKCDNFDLSVDVEEVNTGKEEEDVIRSVKITICTRYLDTVDATMSILDVTMLTGFSPDVQDLRRLSEGVDRYISKFELDQDKERSNVVIYLDKVGTLGTRGWGQDWDDDRCTRFYHPDKEGGKLNKICQGDVCRCAEESCFKRQEKPEAITVNQRMERACEPGVDFVYKVRVVAREETPSHDNYVMEVLTVIKMGTATSGGTRPPR